MFIAGWDLATLVWSNAAKWIIVNDTFYSTYNFLSTGKTISFQLIGTGVLSNITGMVTKLKMFLC